MAWEARAAARGVAEVAPEIRHTQLKEQIAEILRHDDRTVADIVSILGEDIGAVESAVDDLFKDGRVTFWRGCVRGPRH